jgi:hypothetical protein
MDNHRNKSFQVKKFGRKCQHSPQFIFTTDKIIIEKNIKLIPTNQLVLQLMPHKFYFKVENFGRKCQHSPQIYFQKNLKIKDKINTVPINASKKL